MAIRRHNLFLALQPDSEAAASIGRLMDRLCRGPGLGGKLIKQSSLHISLLSLGEHDDIPHELIERAAIALSAVTMCRFAVELNHLVNWNERTGQPLLVFLGDDGVIGVDMLRRQIHAALAEASVKPRRFDKKIPHLTLAYGGRALPDEIIAPVRWMVREFVLIDSLVGEGRHVVLNRWPLTSADAALSGTPPSPYEGQNRLGPEELT